jgi:hypothetical protein
MLCFSMQTHDFINFIQNLQDLMKKYRQDQDWVNMLSDSENNTNARAHLAIFD